MISLKDMPELTEKALGAIFQYPSKAKLKEKPDKPGFNYVNVAGMLIFILCPLFFIAKLFGLL